MMSSQRLLLHLTQFNMIGYSETQLTKQQHSVNHFISNY